MTSWFRRNQSEDEDEFPFLIVLIIEVVAIGYAAAEPAHWLRAVGGMVVGLAVAGLFRLVLTDERVGLLRVRRRGFDVACYWGFGLLALAFALALPQR